MRRRIDIRQARELLLTREQLLATGSTVRRLRADVAEHRLIRLHRGAYVRAEDLATLWWEGRHLLKVLAVRAASPGPGPVFSHTSAAVLWGLPLYGVRDEPVQIVLDGRRHSRVIAGVIRRDMQLPANDVMELDGLRLTSLARTTLDVARTGTFEMAVGCADAALRQVSGTGQERNPDADAEWRADALKRALPGLRGVRQARRVIEFADGRAQLPGESVSRVRLHQLGFTDYDLQMPVTGSLGNQYWVDFGFLRARSFGEFDGEAKYIETSLRSAPTAQGAVLAEKRREDDIRGVTGWGFARWGYEHIRTPEALGARLAAFGVRPPG